MKAIVFLTIISTVLATSVCLKCYRCYTGKINRNEKIYRSVDCYYFKREENYCASSQYCIRVRYINPWGNEISIYECDNATLNISPDIDMKTSKCSTEFCNRQYIWRKPESEPEVVPTTFPSTRNSNTANKAALYYIVLVLLMIMNWILNRQNFAIDNTYG